ncbi:hypothetical protein [Crocinitomix catalasitica]|uniref:hypothetical protein n=1 Tax=Crocinitomix catalasitica TaxID=184607 RepID=UPI0012FCC2B0|nr:hypothetical protein [Crocinitomix catalasitica]
MKFINKILEWIQNQKEDDAWNVFSDSPYSLIVIAIGALFVIPMIFIIIWLDNFF